MSPLTDAFRGLTDAIRQVMASLSSHLRHTHLTHLRRNEAGLVRRPSVVRRVEKGAALLDAQQPGWEVDVDPNYLFIESHVRCVLGQLFGDYRIGIKRLGLTRGKGPDYGFNATNDAFSIEQGLDYLALNTEWRRLIADRQKEMV